MKLAIVCDDLIQFGGQEKLVMALCEAFPEATLYTSVVSGKWRKILKEKNIQCRVSFLQKFPFIEKLNRYYSVFLVHVLAFERFKLEEFDTVLSVSSRYAHHIITKPTTRHVCYMNTPGRMLWEPFDYFENETFGLLRMFKRIGQKFLAFPLSLLRMLDFAAAQRVDFFIANSRTAQARIKKYYGRESEVVYPFVGLSPLKDLVLSKTQPSYFLIITRLVPWKKVEIAIAACAKLNIPLKIIGEGPDLSRLKKLAALGTVGAVQFLGYVSENEKTETIKNCRALINTQLEDFGIVPLEAMACGKPVIAFGKGGALETVLPSQTGEFFYEQTSDALIKILQSFNDAIYSPQKCIDHAYTFNKDTFVAKIKQLLK